MLNTENFPSVRSLAEPAVLLRAALAGTFSALACYPRLANWTHRKDDVWFLVAVVGWAAFVMWAAVFAWHERHSAAKLFPREVALSGWLTALGLGAAGGAVMFLFVDPELRKIAPTDFPATPGQWLDRMLFNLALEQLFLCFAAFAFLARLFQSRRAATIGVVLFSLLVFALKLQSVGARPSGELVLLLAVFRAVSSAATVWLYLRGGVWLVWLFAFALQCRHLFALG